MQGDDDQDEDKNKLYSMLIRLIPPEVNGPVFGFAARSRSVLSSSHEGKTVHNTR